PAAEFSGVGCGADADRDAARPGASERGGVPAPKLVERPRLRRVPRRRDYLLLVQRPAAAGRAGEDERRRLRSLPRHDSVVPARLQPGGTTSLGGPHSWEWSAADLGVLQQRPRSLCDP